MKEGRQAMLLELVVGGLAMKPTSTSFFLYFSGGGGIGG
jgi:hypothetical protein